MKVFNNKFQRYSSFKPVREAFATILPEAVELLDHDIVSVSTRRPSWDNSYVYVDGKQERFTCGGIDIVIQPEGINYTGNEPKISFGVRTDKDGYIDLGKLAKKFEGKMASIKEAVERHERNISIRKENNLKRRANSEVLDKLVEEGLLDNIYEVTEMTEGFRVSLDLKDEDELRAYLAFKKQIEEAREVTA